MASDPALPLNPLPLVITRALVESPERGSSVPLGEIFDRLLQKKGFRHVKGLEGVVRPIAGVNSSSTPGDDYDYNERDQEKINRINEFANYWVADDEVYVVEDGQISRVVGDKKYLLQNGQTEAFLASDPENVAYKLALNTWSEGSSSFLFVYLQNAKLLELDEEYQKMFNYGRVAG